MKTTRITKSKCVKGGTTMKKMSTAKTKSVKGGAAVTKKAATVAPKAKKEKVMKKDILAAINSLSKQLSDLKKEMK